MKYHSRLVGGRNLDSVVGVVNWVMVGRPTNLYVIRGRDKRCRPTYIFSDTPGWVLRPISFLIEFVSVAVFLGVKWP